MLGSPLYGGLAGLLAEDPRPVRPILGDDASWDLVLRLFGGVHRLVLAGAAPDALSGDPDDFLTALDAHAGELRRFVAKQGVQTNETQRSVGLLPVFLTIARETGLPLDLLELGPSAGLNLVFDHYGYVLANGTWGDPAARLTFEVTERAPVPAELLQTPIEVRHRRGIDLAPVDVTSDEGAQLLRAFVWPGLEERVTRLDAAIETLRHAPQKPRAHPGELRRAAPGPPRRASCRHRHGRLPDSLDRIPSAGRPQRPADGARAGRGGRSSSRLGVDALLRRARARPRRRVGARAPRLARASTHGGVAGLPRQLARVGRLR